MAVPGKGEYPIKLGTLLFTMVEPEQGHEVEYNRWYEHDHFYSGCMVGPWQFAGDRFVATRRLKDLRYPAETDMTPDPLTGSYLAVYWVLAVTTTSGTGGRSSRSTWLHANGRMFEERTHVHTLLYEKRWAHRARTRRLHHRARARPRLPGAGRRVPATSKEGHTHDEVDAWFQRHLPPRRDARSRGAPSSCSTRRRCRCSTTVPPTCRAPAAGPNRFLQLHFLDHDPEEGWADGYATIGQAIEASGLATHVWTGPFIQTDFGTDTYTDELW